MKLCDFALQEFILSPSQLSIPNTRFRYYCLARKSSQFPFKSDGILQEFPSINSSPENSSDYGRLVEDYLDTDVDSFTDFLLLDSLLEKRATVLDIARPDSNRTMCFTKAYTHYTEGTGSVFCPLSKENVETAFDRFKATDSPSNGLEQLRSLRMRYFTPSEVARLMCFPVDRNLDGVALASTFSFPKVTTKRQKYRLLGNSINVFVVSLLIRVLFEQ